MLQVRSMCRWDPTRIGLKAAVDRLGGKLLAQTNLGGTAETPGGPAPQAASFELDLADGSARALLANDRRFAAFLPVRLAICEQSDGVFLTAMAPREWCRVLHRPDLEPAAAALEERLCAVMEAAAVAHLPFPFQTAYPTEDQVNMRAEVPQRIDPCGTKVEDLAGTGVHDSQGG